MKKICSLLLMLAMLLACFFGCSKIEETDNDLWVVTEKTWWDGMNGLTQTLIDQFQETHEDINIKLDILPLDKEEREVYLEQLRASIMSGKGPDIYLLPTSGFLHATSVNLSEYLPIEKLFPDESLAMHNGHFTDISEYYDADEALNKEELVTAVMDGGVIGDARYILPLRYDYPVIYAATDRLESLETDLNVLKSGVVTDIMDLAIETNNGLLADGGVTAYFDGDASNYLVHLPQLVDYEEGKIVLSKDEISDYLNKAQTNFAVSSSKYRTLKGCRNCFLDLDEIYLTENWHVGSSSNVLSSGYLHNAIEMSAVSKAAGVDVTMIPVRNADGELVASVTYYGAVGSSCENPEMAYEFLRLFLLEESQWELNRLRPDLKRAAQGTKMMAMYPGYIEKGFPVRSLCEPENLSQAYFSLLKLKESPYLSIYQHYFDTVEGARPRYKGVLRAELTEDDLSILDVPIDRVVFDQTFGLDLSGMFYDLVFMQTATPDEMAGKIVKAIEMYLAEG